MSKNELIFRFLNKKDYKTICEWWKWWRWPIIPFEMLPETGFMIEKNEIPIVSAYLYLTNSTTAILEWIVSNPNYRENDRQEAIELLINEAEVFCKKMKYKHIFSIGKNKHLIKTHEKLGWQVDKRPSFEINKKL